MIMIFVAIGIIILIIMFSGGYTPQKDSVNEMYRRIAEDKKNNPNSVWND